MKAETCGVRSFGRVRADSRAKHSWLHGLVMLLSRLPEPRGFGVWLFGHSAVWFSGTLYAETLEFNA